MKSNLQGIRKKTLTVFVLYILVYYFLLFAMPEMKTILSDILSLAGSLIALVVIKIGMQWQPPEHKKTWFTFGIGVFLYMAGDFLWLVYELVLGREIPFPSLCDVFYLSSPICYCFAIFFLIRK